MKDFVLALPKLRRYPWSKPALFQAYPAMPSYLIKTILVFAVLYALIAIVLRVRTHRYKLLAAELVLVAALVSIVHVLFDLRNPIVEFGAPRFVMIMICFFAMIIGMMAHYFFELWGEDQPAPFRWTSFVQPLLISPIVFLPLLGLIPETSDKPIGEREIFVWVNAFQNGFFWRVVYDRVQRQMAD